MNVPAVRASSMPWLAQSPAAPEHRIRHVDVPAVRASSMPWLAQSPAAPEHRMRHVNEPAGRASSMPWLAQSPAATPTTVSPSPEPLSVKSAGFDASSLVHAMAGTDAWGNCYNNELFFCATAYKAYRIGASPLSNAFYAVTGAEPCSNSYDSELLAPAFCLHTTWFRLHIGDGVSWHALKRGFAGSVYQALITGSAVLSALNVPSSTSSHIMNMSSHFSRCTGQGVKAGQAAEGQ